MEPGRDISSPTVSVIVRTVGRETLARTLQCIERQSWRPIEAVVVRARDVALPASNVSIPVRTVGGTALDRPHAANHGLEAASGEWLLFLDEDDLIEPGHVQALVEAARRSGKRVAYSQTRLVDPAGNTQRVFGGPFHRELLRRSNYLAIHAVLFHRSFVDAGLRFDESFASFEDWDFWLQLAGHGDFEFVREPTAIYHAAAGASGAGHGANLDRDAVLRQREKLMRKWGIA